MRIALGGQGAFGVKHLEALAKIDGVEVIRGIRRGSATPIIVLSARHQSVSKVEALDAGADDYVTKPFGMDELLARLRAAVRRGAPAPDEPVVGQVMRPGYRWRGAVVRPAMVMVRDQ